nr:SLC13/DASS family transporter [Alistipes sp.]
MQPFDKYIVLVAIIVMVGLLIKDKMRPGILLFSVVVIFMSAGILTPTEALAGFSNKGMITVGLLFLVSEGVRRSDALGAIMKWIFPSKERSSVAKGIAYIMGFVASASAFLNNTPIVVIFIPHIKAWAKRVGLPLKKFLIPLSYAAILGGMCTLIGTSTNLVVHGLMLDAGLEGFTMFELGKVGGLIAIAGIAYILIFGNRLLPDDDGEPIEG